MAGLNINRRQVYFTTTNTRAITMRFRVIISTGVDSMSFPDKEHAADFRHKQHAVGFCDHIRTYAYVVDCFDDTIVYCNRK
jgi:hypothetical protein